MTASDIMSALKKLPKCTALFWCTLQ